MEKVVTLCRKGSCCPTVRITDERIEIGEKENLCILTVAEWDLLKEKILKREI